MVLSQLKISQKIYLMGAIQLFCILLVGGIGYTQMEKIGTEIQDIARDDIPLTKALTLLAEHQLQQAIYFERTLLYGVLTQQEIPKAEEKFLKSKDKLLALAKKVKQKIIDTEHFIEDAITHLHSKEAVQEYKGLLVDLKEIEGRYDVLLHELNKIISFLEQGNIKDALAEAVVIEALEDELDHKIIEVLAEIENFTLEATLQAERDEKQGVKYIMTMLVISLVVSTLLPLLIGRSITSPIHELDNRLKQVANGDGDLSQRLDDSHKDETSLVAVSFNHFMEKLSMNVIDIKKSSVELSTFSKEAISVMDETLDNVKSQREETEAVAKVISSINDATQDVVQSTLDATKIAKDARNYVSKGKDAAVDTQNIIKQLSSEVSGASSVIESLATETDNIGNVLEAIRGIADQTNLLALNAAIEAARAGDTGRGFAVVADEVRSLAQRTQSSTGDIQELVERLQSEAKNAVNSMKKGSDSTEVCLSKSIETAEALEAADKAVNDITNLNKHIASITDEQSSAVKQINDNVIVISKISNQTSDAAAKTSIANQNIAKSLGSLRSIVDQFKT